MSSSSKSLPRTPPLSPPARSYSMPTDNPIKLNFPASPSDTSSSTLPYEKLSSSYNSASVISNVLNGEKSSVTSPRKNRSQSDSRPTKDSTTIPRSWRNKPRASDASRYPPGSHSSSAGSPNSYYQQQQQMQSINNRDLGMHSSCITGNIGIIKWALDQGQSIHATLNGLQAIHIAAACGDIPILTFLVANGADINAKRIPRQAYYTEFNSSLSTNGGSTPLHFACASGNPAVVSFLLGLGAHPAIKDEFGVLPIDISLHKGNNKCFGMLSEAMNALNLLRDKEPIDVERRSLERKLEELGLGGDDFNIYDSSK